MTLNYGVRWEPYLSPYNTVNENEHFDPTLFAANYHTNAFANAPAGLIFPSDPQYTSGKYINGQVWDKFYPRLGLAWDPEGNGRMTIRAGFGMFGDRASMLNSLEVRAPLLDYRLIEFAFGKVPSQLKATAHGRQILLKKLAERILPREFDQQRKQGFSIPLAAWLQSGPWKAFFRETLLGSDSTVFDHRVISKLLHGQANGRANSERLFALVLFELWRREYRISI